MQRFANVTKTLIMQGNIKRAKRCLQTAEYLLTQGTTEVKNAIADVYVYSVSSFLEVCHCNIKDLFPEKLSNAYKKQINANYP